MYRKYLISHLRRLRRLKLYSSIISICCVKGSFNNVLYRRDGGLCWCSKYDHIIHIMEYERGSFSG